MPLKVGAGWVSRASVVIFTPAAARCLLESGALEGSWGSVAITFGIIFDVFMENVHTW